LSLAQVLLQLINASAWHFTSMKTLIVCSSQTGNTRKLAEAVKEVIGGETALSPVGEAPDTAGFDLIVLGFWPMTGKPDPKSSDLSGFNPPKHLTPRCERPSTQAGRDPTARLSGE
jgi:hypothetical protein